MAVAVWAWPPPFSTGRVGTGRECALGCAPELRAVILARAREGHRLGRHVEARREGLGGKEHLVEGGKAGVGVNGCWCVAVSTECSLLPCLETSVVHEWLARGGGAP